MSTCFCATLRLSEGALRSLIYSCVISKLHRKRKGVCVCLGGLGSIKVLTNSSTATPRTTSPLHKSSFQEKQANVLFLKNVCWVSVLPCSWRAETVLLRRPNQPLLRKQVFPPARPHPHGGCFDGYSAGGVVLLLFPSLFPVCC